MDSQLILLIEDNSDDVFLATRIISRHTTIEVIVRCTCVEALAYLLDEDQHNRAVLPVVVFLDLRLPDRSGIEVLEAIRASERLQEIPVVVLSSSRQNSELVRCKELNVLDCLQKPLCSNDFQRIMERIGALS